MLDRVSIALRAYAVPRSRRSRKKRLRGSREGDAATTHRRGPPRWRRAVLIFDTETTVDPTQRLLFGTYRYGRWRGRQLVIVEEGLIYADELPTRDPAGFAALQRSFAEPGAAVAPTFPRTLSRRPPPYIA